MLVLLRSYTFVLLRSISSSLVARDSFAAPRLFIYLTTNHGLQPCRVDGVLPLGCHPTPHRTGQADFPTSGSSSMETPDGVFQADAAKRIETPINLDRRPAHPIQRAPKALP